MARKFLPMGINRLYTIFILLIHTVAIGGINLLNLQFNHFD